MMKHSRGRRSGYTYAEGVREDFWTEFATFAAPLGKRMHLPEPRPWFFYRIPVGRTGFELSLTIRVRGPARCELYISHQKAKRAFRRLRLKEAVIKRRLGSLKWEFLPGRHACRIAEYYLVDINQRKNWPGLLRRFRTRAQAFHSVFTPLVANLDLPSRKDRGAR